MSAFGEDKLTYFIMKNFIKIVFSVHLVRSTKLQLVMVLCNMSDVQSKFSSVSQVSVA